ncbi:MAG: BON domain-containing protein [Proteobacteria bacterium]|nr:BON domain-containing protein [Pseudomonadota bacterium]
MKNIIKSALIICTFLIPTITNAAPASTDGALESRLEDAFYYNSFLDSHDISVNVEKGTATLKGSVPTAVEKDLAHSIAMTIEGITAVNNNIEINENAPGHSRVGYVQIIRDLTTSASIKSRLLANKNTAGSDIKVETKNDLVTLSGNVKIGKEKEVAEKIAMNTAHVEDVENKLHISNPQNIGEKVENAAETVSQNVSDAWISTKVRSMLTFEGDFPGNKIKVTTAQGVVSLSGSVRSNLQHEQIAIDVLDIYGVKSVNNNTIIVAAK